MSSTLTFGTTSLSRSTPLTGRICDFVGPAVILGVVVSTVLYVQMSSVLRTAVPSLIAGLAVGTIVAGLIVRARGWPAWLAVGARVVAAQLLLGIAVFVFLLALRAEFQGV